MASYRAKLPVVSSGGAVIKSVQRNSTVITGSSLTKTVPLAFTVDTSKAYIRGVKVVADSVVTAREGPAVAVRATLTPSSVVLTRSSYVNLGDKLTISFEVVEYSSGVSVQRGQFSSSSTSGVILISAIDASRSLCESTWSGQAVDTAFSGYTETLDPTRIVITREYNATILIAWQVVTYV